MKGILKKWLPDSWRNYYAFYRQRGRLKSIPAQKITTDHLPKITENKLTQIFHHPKTHAEWKGMTQELKALQFPEFTKGVNQGDRKALFYLVRHLQAKSILEIGTHIGSSTVAMALGMKIEHNVEKKLISVDIRDVNDKNSRPWLSYGSPLSPKELVNRINCSHFVRFVHSDSVTYLENSREQFDLIFLDGGKLADVSYRELQLAIPRLKKGGFLLVHDFYPEGQSLWAAQKRVICGPFLAIKKLKQVVPDLEVVPFKNLPWPTKYGTHTTSLAIVCRKKGGA